MRVGGREGGGGLYTIVHIQNYFYNVMLIGIVSEITKKKHIATSVWITHDQGCQGTLN